MGEACFGFEAYTSLLGLDGVMQLAVGKSAAQVSYSNGNAWDLDTCQLSKLLFDILVQQVRGKALVIVRSAERHNGADAWRLLANRVTLIQAIGQFARWFDIALRRIAGQVAQQIQRTNNRCQIDVVDW